MKTLKIICIFLLLSLTLNANQFDCLNNEELMKYKKEQISYLNEKAKNFNEVKVCIEDSENKESISNCKKQKIAITDIYPYFFGKATFK